MEAAAARLSSARITTRRLSRRGAMAALQYSRLILDMRLSFELTDAQQGQMNAIAQRSNVSAEFATDGKAIYTTIADRQSDIFVVEMTKR